jgi:hypothetical protein
VFPSSPTVLASGPTTRSGTSSALSYTNPRPVPASSWWFGRRNPQSLRPHPRHERRSLARWSGAWRRLRRNSPRRSGTVAEQQSCQAFVMPSRSSCEGSSRVVAVVAGCLANPEATAAALLDPIDLGLAAQQNHP